MLRWLPLEAVKASYWQRVNLGDTDGRSEAENRRKIDLPAEARSVPSRPLMNVTITG